MRHAPNIVTGKPFESVEEWETFCRKTLHAMGDAAGPPAGDSLPADPPAGQEPPDPPEIPSGGTAGDDTDPPGDASPADPPADPSEDEETTRKPYVSAVVAYRERRGVSALTILAVNDDDTVNGIVFRYAPQSIAWRTFVSNVRQSKPEPENDTDYGVWFWPTTE